MKKPIVCSVILLAFAHGPAQAFSVPLRVSNALSACVNIHITDTSIHNNMVLASTTFQLNKSIAECGCRSALVGYDSMTSVNTAAQVLQKGLIGVNRSGNKTLVLASEQTLIADREILLQFHCAPDL